MITKESEENYKSGYIKLFRSIKNKGWYSKSEYVHLWVHLLIKATHKGIEYFFNGQNIILNPGQFITGRKTLSNETGINESKIERILNFLEKNEHQIEQQKTNKNRVITILNWDSYQNIEQEYEQQLNNKRTTSEQQLNTYKNDKNNKNDNNFNFKKELIKLGIEEKIASDWLKVRAKKKASNTETAFNRIKSEIELCKLSPNDCIKLAVENSWQGFKSEWCDKYHSLNKNLPSNSLKGENLPKHLDGFVV